MKTLVRPAGENPLSRNETCLAGIASDPAKLSYWIEIERIWRRSLESFKQMNQGCAKAGCVTKSRDG